MVPGSKSPFDHERLRKFLDSWYDKQMSTALRKPRTDAELQKYGGTVFDIQPEMASTKAVTVLLALKDILGFEPSKKVIKKGGYSSKSEFINEISARIDEVCESEHTVKMDAIPKSEKKEIDGHAQL
jgi:hypothetical protein